MIDSGNEAIEHWSHDDPVVVVTEMTKLIARVVAEVVSVDTMI